MGTATRHKAPVMGSRREQGCASERTADWVDESGHFFSKDARRKKNDGGVRWLGAGQRSPEANAVWLVPFSLWAFLPSPLEKCTAAVCEAVGCLCPCKCQYQGRGSSPLFGGRVPSALRRGKAREGQARERESCLTASLPSSWQAL